MRHGLFVLFLFLLLVFALSRQFVWILIGGIVLLAYFAGLVLETSTHGGQQMRLKARAAWRKEFEAMEKAQGKYPRGFFESTGKAAVEKINEYHQPKGAKNYPDALNYKWSGKNPPERLADAAEKAWKGLEKLFGK